MTITVDSPVTTADAGPDVTICGTSGFLNVTGSAPSKGTGRWTQVSGNAATIETPDNYTTEITGLVSGVYIFRYTITNGACSSYDDVTVVGAFSGAGRVSEKSAV